MYVITQVLTEWRVFDVAVKLVDLKYSPGVSNATEKRRLLGTY